MAQATILLFSCCVFMILNSKIKICVCVCLDIFNIFLLQLFLALILFKFEKYLETLLHYD